MYRKLIKNTLKELTSIYDVQVDFPADITHGDYSTNIALINAKKENLNPRDYAQSLVEKLKNNAKLSEIFSKIEIAGPGFINFFISDQSLIDQLNDNKKPEIDNKKTIVVEYSSPNIAKRFSIGHFRSTVIGDSIYRIYKYLGYNTIGVNHPGDWGTQFGMILAEIELTNTSIEDISIDELEELYKNFNSKLDTQPELRENAKLWFKKLEDGDQIARERWQKIYDISFAEFAKTYQVLGVDIQKLEGESFYEDKMPAVISQAEELYISTIGDKGAKIVEFNDLPPAMLVKSDETTTYFTRDLAAIKYRVEQYSADVIIYEVGAEQTLHFKQVFAAAKKFDWGKNVELIHVPHGLVRLKDGKMSTRKGNTIKLNEIIDKAIEKSSDPKIAIGALKYNDLKRNPAGEIIFDWDEVLSMEGNSGPYLQYSVVRAKSVLNKANENPAHAFNLENPNLEENEAIVVRKLSRFNEVIVDAAKMYSPSTLATYLYELASEFNSFYNSNKIIGDDREVIRLIITNKFVKVMTTGLELLGIQVPEKM